MGKCAGLVAVGMGMFLTASPALAAPAFTAEAIHAPPGQSPETGRVFISEQGSRFEFERKGRPVIQIMLPGQAVMRLLFPEDKTYVEMTQLPQSKIAHPKTPCPLPEVAQCEQTAVETLNGRSVEVWRITFNQMPGDLAAGKKSIASGPIQIWWDAERKVAIREQYPDGGLSTTTLRGRVDHQGRSVEHWQVTLTRPDGETVQMSRWYDPELQTDVREERPNGTVREFRNIRLVAPDPAWFAVPAGYRRVDSPVRRNGRPAHPPGAPSVPTPQPGEAYLLDDADAPAVR